MHGENMELKGVSCFYNSFTIFFTILFWKIWWISDWGSCKSGVILGKQK